MRTIDSTQTFLSSHHRILSHYSRKLTIHKFISLQFRIITVSASQSCFAVSFKTSMRSRSLCLLPVSFEGNVRPPVPLQVPSPWPLGRKRISPCHTSHDSTCASSIFTFEMYVDRVCFCSGRGFCSTRGRLAPDLAVSMRSLLSGLLRAEVQYW